MNPWDALIHLVNFALPALCVGWLGAAFSKLLWRGTLHGVALRRLGMWASAAGLAALVAGLVVFGRDGKMATYGAMVIACAAGLWWAGWGPGRR